MIFDAHEVVCLVVTPQPELRARRRLDSSIGEESDIDVVVATQNFHGLMKFYSVDALFLCIHTVEEGFSHDMRCQSTGQSQSNISNSVCLKLTQWKQQILVKVRLCNGFSC